MKEGLSGFSEHEVLEFLLMFAIPQRDVNPLAHRLIDRFGSLSAVLESSPAELTRVDGVGENAAALLSLMPQLMGYYQHSAMGRKPVITNLAEARKYAGALFFGLHEERVYMICVDQSGRVLHPALMHRGTIDQVQRSSKPRCGITRMPFCWRTTTPAAWPSPRRTTMIPPAR